MLFLVGCAAVVVGFIVIAIANATDLDIQWLGALLILAGFVCVLLSIALFLGARLP
jgi:hypothetical protein